METLNLTETTLTEQLLTKLQLQEPQEQEPQEQEQAQEQTITLDSFIDETPLKKFGFTPWPSIECYSAMLQQMKWYPEYAEVIFRAKIKLHGTNAAIHCSVEGIGAQSRNRMLKAGVSDNAGFCRWVTSNQEVWKRLPPCIVYGEWCGKGIQKDDAVCEISPHFCIFSVVIKYPSGGRIIVDPEHIKTFLTPAFQCPTMPENVRIIPWHRDPVKFYFDYISQRNNANDTAIEMINQWVHEIGQEDPYVLSEFGVKGPGEGLVFYGILDSTRTLQDYKITSNFMFKAKALRHAIKLSKNPVEKEIVVLPNAQAFATMFVTEARCEQAIQEVGDGKQSMGAFIQWMMGDIEKEGKYEQAQADIPWKILKTYIVEASKAWWFKRQRGIRNAASRNRNEEDNNE